MDGKGKKVSRAAPWRPRDRGFADVGAPHQAAANVAGLLCPAHCIAHAEAPQPVAGDVAGRLTPLQTQADALFVITASRCSFYMEADAPFTWNNFFTTEH